MLFYALKIVANSVDFENAATGFSINLVATLSITIQSLKSRPSNFVDHDLGDD